jgi:hypothetical protein
MHRWHRALNALFGVMLFSVLTLAWGYGSWRVWVTLNTDAWFTFSLQALFFIGSTLLTVVLAGCAVGMLWVMWLDIRGFTKAAHSKGDNDAQV